MYVAIGQQDCFGIGWYNIYLIELLNFVVICLYIKKVTKFTSHGKDRDNFAVTVECVWSTDP
jgi:hypothetical protein